MTQTENPFHLLYFLQDKNKLRQLRLICVAMCRDWWVTHPGHELCKNEKAICAVQTSEWYADLKTTTLYEDRQLYEAHYNFNNAFYPFHFVAMTNPYRAALDLADMSACSLTRYGEIIADTVRVKSRFKRGLVQTWRTELTQSLAEDAYEHRLKFGVLDSVKLNILADSLEDIGCDQRVVDHLRLPRRRYRGCWALDLIRGVA